MGRPPISWTGWRLAGGGLMTRAIETRLRKLEANAPAKRVRYVFSMTSDPAEWDREVASLIANRKANACDEFVRVGGCLRHIAGDQRQEYCPMLRPGTKRRAFLLSPCSQ